MSLKRRFQFGETDKMLSAGADMPVREYAEGKDGEPEEEKQTPVRNAIGRIDEPVNTAFVSRFVKREKMVFSRENDYPIEAVEKLADSILELGLIHNIEVFYNEDEDIYIVDSGEQRTRAIDLLIETYRDFKDKDSPAYKKYLRNVRLFEEKGYPCKVVMPINDSSLSAEEAALYDDLTRQIRIIEANETDRKKNPAVTRKKIEELDRLMKKRQELLSRSEKINVNEEIGKMLNITERQVTKYKAVERLIPELKELFDRNGITLNDGANYAKLSPEEQRQLLTVIEAGEGKKEVHALYEKLNRLQAEISDREQNMKRLEEEKSAALKMMEEQRRSAASLEDKIRTELANEREEAGRGQVNKLQDELALVNASLEEYKKKLERISEEHEKETAELKEKLSEKERNKRTVPPALLKETLHMDTLLRTIAASMRELQEALKKYKQVYEEGCGEKPPEEYEAEIKKLTEHAATD